MTNTHKLYKGNRSPQMPYLEGEVRIGYGRDSFKVDGPLDKSLQAIVKKYGIKPEQLFTIAMPAITITIWGSLWILGFVSIAMMTA